MSTLQIIFVYKNKKIICERHLWCLVLTPCPFFTPAIPPPEISLAFNFSEQYN